MKKRFGLILIVLLLMTGCKINPGKNEKVKSDEVTGSEFMLAIKDLYNICYNEYDKDESFTVEANYTYEEKSTNYSYEESYDILYKIDTTEKSYFKEKFHEYEMDEGDEIWYDGEEELYRNYSVRISEIMVLVDAIFGYSFADFKYDSKLKCYYLFDENNDNYDFIEIKVIFKDCKVSYIEGKFCLDNETLVEKASIYDYGKTKVKLPEE